MGYKKAHADLNAGHTEPGLSAALGLTNLGFSVYILNRGEGYDFFHNHREQEEVYMCIEGAADIVITKGGTGAGAGVGAKESAMQRITLHAGDVVRVDPDTLRAIGNLSSDRAVVVIAGACRHTYPAGFGHHDVINDVLSVVGHGTTGFAWPNRLEKRPVDSADDDCAE